jgi:phospholipase C
MARSRTRSPRSARGAAGNRKPASAPTARPVAKASPQPATTAASVGPGALPPIDCVVVLMQENRAFDHLFGQWPGAAGIESGSYSNRPNPSLPAGPGNLAISTGQPAQFTVAQGQGPGHSLDDTNVQLFTSKIVAPGTALKPVNDRGFVQDYLRALAMDGVRGAAADASAVMQTFRPGELPALSALATNFVLCDQWFAEVPGPTMPNRLYMHAATSVGWARNDWSVPLSSVTIYEQLQKNQRTWAVYFSDQNEVAQYSRINTQRANFKLYESAFAADAAAGKLANYCFIIPRFAGSAADGPATSMHPPQDVRPGDQLIADVYAALRGGPQWPRSLYIVTFDEHGGYFDHADPPPAVNPDGINSPAPGDTASFAPTFAFDRLGLRVPTLLVSPYLPKGVVYSKPLQHTSVLATVRELFGVSGALTRRDAAAATFEDLFLSVPRSDTPASLSTGAVPPAAPIDATRAAPDDFMSEMARQWRRATGGLPGTSASAVVPASQDEVHRFLRSQIQLFLDHRARRAAAKGARTKNARTRRSGRR